jgi:hypothetical protein
LSTSYSVLPSALAPASASSDDDAAALAAAPCPVRDFLRGEGHILPPPCSSASKLGLPRSGPSWHGTLRGAVDVTLLGVSSWLAPGRRELVGGSRGPEGQGRTWGGRAGGEGGVPTMAAAGSDKIAVRNHILGAKNHYGAFRAAAPAAREPLAAVRRSRPAARAQFARVHRPGGCVCGAGATWLTAWAPSCAAEVMSLSKECGEEEVKKRHRELVRLVHPDKLQMDSEAEKLKTQQAFRGMCIIMCQSHRAAGGVSAARG